MFVSDNFTEELLEVHEQELEKVKSYYEEHKHMFKMVEKRESMFKKMREFEVCTWMYSTIFQ